MQSAIRSEAAAQLAIAAPLQERARIAAAWCNIKPAPRRTIMQAPRPASIYRATLAAALAGFALLLSACGGGDECEQSKARDCGADPVQTIPAQPDRARSL